ncbi:hypothetical protein [Labrys neptuniae]
MLLDTEAWDLAVDTAGNIAVASEPYSLAQDAASAIRLFLNELYYDTSQGIPYFEQVLGRRPPISLMKAHFNRQAMSVPGVVKAQSFITDWTDRKVSGQVQVWDANGNASAAGF